MHAVLVLVQLVLVVGAFMLPAFERVVEGSMAKLLLDAGVDFTSYISMWSLPAMVARDGGLDYLMAATFTLFIVIAPVPWPDVACSSLLPCGSAPRAASTSIRVAS